MLIARGGGYVLSLLAVNMQNRSLHLVRLLGMAAGYLLLFALCLILTRPYKMAVSYPFQLALVWFAVFACLRRTIRHPSRMSLPWSLLSAGILLWAVGISLGAWEDLSRNAMQDFAYASDLFYFLYGVPVLLAISLPTEGERISLLPWLDGAQVMMTSCLAYVTLFSVFPFMHQAPQPISADLLQKTYNIENFVLALAVTLRLFAHPRSGETRRFYRILAVFLWAYALCAMGYNHMVIALQEQMGLYDLLVVAPFLLLAVGAFLPPAEEPSPSGLPEASSLTVLIDNACPIFYTVALLALGIAVVRAHLYWGITAIVMALAIYAVRSTLQQSRFLRTQRTLREARDQLEVLSLRDSLTGVANRRCFDQVLAVEWARAARLRHPLSLLLIDVDYFKSLNDRYGHPSGDQCLVRIAGALRSTLIRSNDLLARYGGEEFAAILVDADREGAEVVAARMQAAVRALNIRNETSLGEFVTISIGIATCQAFDGPSIAELIEASDRALYQAKQRGRNRIECWPMQPGS